MTKSMQAVYITALYGILSAAILASLAFATFTSDPARGDQPIPVTWTLVLTLIVIHILSLISLLISTFLLLLMELRRLERQKPQKYST